MKKILILLFSTFTLSVFGQTIFPETTVKLNSSDTFFTKSLLALKQAMTNENVNLDICQSKFPYAYSYYEPNLKKNGCIIHDNSNSSGGNVPHYVTLEDTISFQAGIIAWNCPKIELRILNGVTSNWDLVSNSPNTFKEFLIPTTSMNFNVSTTLGLGFSTQPYRIQGYCNVSDVTPIYTSNSIEFVLIGINNAKLLSTDANNTAILGTDNKIFVPASAATTLISTDGDNGIILGTDNKLYGVNTGNSDLTLTGDRVLDGDGGSKDLWLKDLKDFKVRAFGNVLFEFSNSNNGIEAPYLSNATRIGANSTGKLIDLGFQTAIETPSTAIVASGTQIAVPSTNTQGAINDLATAIKTVDNAKWTKGGDAVTAITNLGTTTAFDLPFITNNTEKMRVASGGNVGIGTNNPVFKLDIVSNVNALSRVSLSNIDVTAYNQIDFRIGRGTNLNDIYIGTNYLGTQNSFIDNRSGGNLNFQNQNRVDATISSSNGYVGIGTQNPLNRLHISGSAVLGTAGIRTPLISASILKTDANGDIIAGTAQTATQTPSTAIVASGTTVAVPSTDVQGAIGDLATAIKTVDNTKWTKGGDAVTAQNSIGTTTNFGIPFITNNTERMHIAANGNIGIGISNPVVKLMVSNSGNFGWEFDAINKKISAYDRITNLYQQMYFRGTDYTFNINNSSNAMVITSSRNVGIAEDNPQNRLHIAGGVAGTGGIRIPLLSAYFLKTDANGDIVAGTLASLKRSYFKGLNGTALAIASGTAINLLTAGDAGSDTFIAADFTTLPTMKELDVYINGVKAYRTTGVLATSAGTAYSITTAGVLTSNVTVNQLEVILNK